MLFNRRRGTSLIETMIALMILAAIGTAVITITLQVQALTNSARLKNMATVYAEQAIEQARSYVQSNGYTALAGFPGIYADGTITQPPTLTACTSGNCSTGQQVSATPLLRCVVVNPPSGNTIFVQSIINWTDQGRCRTTEVDTYFASY